MLVLVSAACGTPVGSSDGGSRDAGVGPDAGQALDAGQTTDAGETADAGEPTDAGSPADAGTTSDAGVDAGLWLPTGDRDVRGAPLPDFLPIGTYAGITACEVIGGTPAPGFGGNAPCGSYEVPVGQCTAGMRGTVTNGVRNQVLRALLFVHEEHRVGNTYLLGNDMRYAQQQNDAFIMKFHTGGAGDFPVVGGLPAGALGAISFAFTGQPNRGQVAVRFASISQRPCDFDYQRLDAQDPCVQRLAIAGGGSLNVHVVPPGVSAGPGFCALRPNTTYYLSTRWEDPLGAARGLISCTPQAGSPTGLQCGTSLAIQ